MNLSKGAMNKARIRCILSGLKRFGLTEVEIELIGLAEQNLYQNGPLVEEIGPILEWIYSRKTAFIRDSVFSMINQKEETPTFLRRKSPLARPTA
jgi:hypothetical protein